MRTRMTRSGRKKMRSRDKFQEMRELKQKREDEGKL
jgi:hypothetical protein